METRIYFNMIKCLGDINSVCVTRLPENFAVLSVVLRVLKLWNGHVVVDELNNTNKPKLVIALLDIYIQREYIV